MCKVEVTAYYQILSRWKLDFDIEDKKIIKDFWIKRDMLYFERINGEIESLEPEYCSISDDTKEPYDIEINEIEQM